MGFPSDYVLIKMFLDRGCISCSEQDNDELRSFGLTCSSVTDFWDHAQNPVWLIELLNFLGCQDTPGLDVFTFESVSRIKHLLDPACWEKATSFVEQHNHHKRSTSTQTSRKQIFAEWVERMESFQQMQCHTDQGKRRSACSHAYDAVRVLFLEDSLVSSEYAVRSASLAVMEEAEKHDPGTGDRARKQFLSDMADILREVIRLPSTPEEYLVWCR